MPVKVNLKLIGGFFSFPPSALSFFWSPAESQPFTFCIKKKVSAGQKKRTLPLNFEFRQTRAEAEF